MGGQTAICRRPPLVSPEKHTRTPELAVKVQIHPIHTHKSIYVINIVGNQPGSPENQAETVGLPSPMPAYRSPTVLLKPSNRSPITSSNCWYTQFSPRYSITKTPAKNQAFPAKSSRTPRTSFRESNTLFYMFSDSKYNI